MKLTGAIVPTLSFLLLSPLAASTPIEIDTTNATDATTVHHLQERGDPFNWARCYQVNPSLVTLIDQFCSNQHIMVPSPYANKGKSGGDGFRVRITGNCAPAEWVPSTYCGMQLRQVCAQKMWGTFWKGQPESLNWGHNGCQKFTIQAA